MVDYDEVGILLEKLLLECVARSDLSFYVEQSTKNANGSLIMVEMNIGIQSRRSK